MRIILLVTSCSMVPQLEKRSEQIGEIRWKGSRRNSVPADSPVRWACIGCGYHLGLFLSFLLYMLADVSNLLCKERKLFSWTVTFSSQSRVNTCCECHVVVDVIQKTTISSIYNDADCLFADDNMTSIARRNVAGVYSRLNGICTYQKSRWWLLNVVFDRSHLSILIF